MSATMVDLLLARAALNYKIGHADECFLDAQKALLQDRRCIVVRVVNALLTSLILCDGLSSYVYTPCIFVCVLVCVCECVCVCGGGGGGACVCHHLESSFCVRCVTTRFAHPALSIINVRGRELSVHLPCGASHHWFRSADGLAVYKFNKSVASQSSALLSPPLLDHITTRHAGAGMACCSRYCYNCGRCYSSDSGVRRHSCLRGGRSIDCSKYGVVCECGQWFQ